MKVFEGNLLDMRGSEVGEVVFNTSMAGYQEILLTLPIQKQIVTLTYPMIGNYRICALDMESDKFKLRVNR